MSLAHLQYKSNLVRDGTPTHAAGSCEHGGSCPVCYGNRTFKNKRRMPMVINDDVENISC
jgi:hypothetical protein